MENIILDSTKCFIFFASYSHPFAIPTINILDSQIIVYVDFIELMQSKIVLEYVFFLQVVYKYVIVNIRLKK
jgi:hypothetical protein